MALILSSSGGVVLSSSGGLANAAVYAAPSAFATDFTLTNTEAATSPVLARIGMPFKQGDVPSGSVPKVTIQGGAEITAIQFDRRTTWPDGSLKFCVCHFRDTDLTASASRIYDLETKVAAYDNTGTFTLTDAKADSSWTLDLSDVQECTSKESLTDAFSTTISDATVTVAHVAHGLSIGDQVFYGGVDDVGGVSVEEVIQVVATVPDADSYTFENAIVPTSSEASGGGAFNAWYYTPKNNHSLSLDTGSTTTRATKVHSGPVCDGYVVWQYAEDDVLVSDDDDLIGVWYVDMWNDGSDTTNGNIECAVKSSMPFWDVVGKANKIYTATFKEGATTKETFTDVNHTYHAEWVTVRTAADNMAGKRHWQTDSQRPTLLYKPNKAYWVTTGVIPPYDTTLTSTSDYSAAVYEPMSNFSHRGKNLEATGGYSGRGLMPKQDATAFMNQTAGDTRGARVNAFAGHHIGHHFRSKATRTRPTESADVANTPIPLILAPYSAGAYDFTSDGLPTAQHAYRAGDATAQGGYTTYIGHDGKWMANSGFSGLSADEDHGTNYTQGMYVLEGEPYLYDCLQDNAMAVNNKFNTEETNLLSYGNTDRRTNWTIGSTLYNGIVCQSFANSRKNGWGLSISMAGWSLCADDDVAKGFCDLLIAQHGDYLTASLANYPTAMTDRGLIWDRCIIGKAEASFFIAFITQGLCYAASLTDNADLIAAGKVQVRWQTNRWNSGSYNMGSYRVHNRYAYGDLSDVADLVEVDVTLTNLNGGNGTVISLSTDIVTASHSYGGNFVVDDPLYFCGMNGAKLGATVPTEVTEGTEYYIKAPTAGASFQAAATPGGAAVDFTSDYTDAACGAIISDADQATNTANGWNDIVKDDTFMQARAGLVMGKFIGSTDVTAQMLTDIDTFMDGESQAGIPQWAFE